MSFFERLGLRGLVYFSAAVSAGCASMSEDECRRADWKAVGLRDGLGGASESMIEDHRKACANAGVTPDAASWQYGRAQGLTSYCTPHGAWAAGLDNRVYVGVCANRDEATFLRYHQAGLALWRARSEMSQNRDLRVRLDGELKKATKDDHRKRIRDDISRAERERDRLVLLLATLELAGPPR